MEYKTRHAEAKLLEYSRYFKVVLLTGARQVGKSTLLKRLFPAIKMLVFDPVQDLMGAREDPELFLNSFPSPLILDEVQYIPEILPALKRRVDLSENPGQYFITGSQNLNVLRSVAESMAGRVGILQLEGMTLDEMSGRGESKGWLGDYLGGPTRFFERFPGTSTAPDNLAKFLWRGGMPGILDQPDSIVPDYFRSYVQTYIERDVRLMGNIRDLAQFGRFAGLAGALTAQEINTSQFGRDIGVTPATAQKWLDLLANTFQWLELPPYHGNALKRLSGKRKGYLRDTGLACYLQRISSPEALLANPLLGAIFETWAVNSIYRRNINLSVPAQIYHWRTNGGAEVDMVLELDGRLYPIEIKCKTRISRHDLSGLSAFRKTYPKKDITPGIIIYGGNECYKADENTVAIPWNM